MSPKHLIGLSLFALTACGSSPTEVASASAQAAAPTFSPGPCEVGIYGEPSGRFVAITRSQDGFRYAFEDGRTGSIEDADDPKPQTPNPKPQTPNPKPQDNDVCVF